MTKSRFSSISILLAFLDIGIINLSYHLCYLIIFGPQSPFTYWNAYFKVLPFVCIGILLSFYIFDLYTVAITRSLLKVLCSLFAAMIINTALIMSYVYIIENSVLPDSVALTATVLEFFLFSISRTIIQLLFREVYKSKRLLFIEKNTSFETRRLIKKFANHKGFSICENANRHELQSVLDEVDVIAINPGIEDKMKVIDLCVKKGKEVLLVPDLIEILLYSAEAQCVDDTLLLSIKPLGLDIRQRFAKRVFDIIISSLMLLVASPIMITLRILIPILSPGPAIFSQERLGEKSLSFKVMKFRSMVDNAEQKTGPVLAVEKDPRITRFGAFLRATRLDELPQLINVIKGDMSIVGPRPERQFFVDQYRESIPYYSYRMAVKPGITGLAQVKGKYTTTPEDKLRFDIMYIRNYSLGLDFSILFQTVRVVFQRERAVGLNAETNTGVKNLVS
ncbi:sugar transferase [Desulfosporosinus sp. OT]|uniref:sugar transferase n=1 Tax=Desulfosporosinus sp. OT TaxID=913865 RepID=UPI000223A939|nr:sugar transferase [Desulfosporosinus sp. OT]EGW38475.1 exopolysaccharide biosynthesis polyprenyl glycosylphosphotransferase family protein [Desulfosporosinus sp. OT]